MDNSEKEKLSLLTELIKMAKSDSSIREEERDFLYAIARQLNVPDEDFERLFDQYIEYTPPKNEFDRIVQFQRLVLMMNVDRHVSEKEITKIREMGIRLGLAPQATNEVLKAMTEYETGAVPPERLISIFKTYHN